MLTNQSAYHLYSSRIVQHSIHSAIFFLYSLDLMQSVNENWNNCCSHTNKIHIVKGMNIYTIAYMHGVNSTMKKVKGTFFTPGKYVRVCFKSPVMKMVSGSTTILSPPSDAAHDRGHQPLSCSLHHVGTLVLHYLRWTVCTRLCAKHNALHNSILCVKEVIVAITNWANILWVPYSWHHTKGLYT